MKNTITKGTEIIGREYPISGDKCVVGQVVAINGDIVTFKKVWDISDKLFYALLKYNGRIKDLQEEHKPIIGSYCAFYRVGDFNSQGNVGFELYTEDTNKSSFLCLVDYFEKEEEPDPTIPKFIDKLFSVASWWELQLANRTITNVVRIFQNSKYYWGNNIYFLSRQGTAFKLLSVWDGEYTKDFRFASSERANIEYYSGYDGNGNFSGLLFSHNRCVLFNQFSSDPTVFVESPRYNSPNKHELATVDWHPYDEAPLVYIKISEYIKQGIEIDGKVIQYIEKTQGFPSTRLRDEINFSSGVYENNIKIGDLKIRPHFHYKDIFSFTEPSRTETNPQFIDDGAIWTNPNSPALVASTTRATVQITARYSGHYGSALSAWKKWTLKFASVFISTTKINLNAESVDTSANSDAIAYLAGNVGSGGNVPGTTLIANFYYPNVLIVIGGGNNGYENIPRGAINWYKWNGSGWVVASAGDTITSLQVEDTWLTKTRQSNIITTSFTLI